jgi:hypothetical protein
MPKTTTAHQKNECHKNATELVRIKSEHMQTMFVLSIVAIIVVGGLGLMAAGIPGGAQILGSVISAVLGYGYGKKNPRRCVAL